MLYIEPAYERLDDIRVLFGEYAASLGIDLRFQNYEDELRELPGSYAPPLGRLYIAEYDRAPAGCVALRPHGDAGCEMKRLFVRPQYRGHKIGRTLAERVIEDAKEAGLRFMLLDTLITLKAAVELYIKLGFYETAPYYDNPTAGTVFMRKDL